MTNRKGDCSVGIIVLIAIMLVIGAVGGTTPDESSDTTVVPVSYAENRGADSWDAGTWQAFRRATTNRWKLSKAEIRDRNGRGPESWLPALDQCRYLSLFMATLERFGLDGNKAEKERLAAQRQRCYTQFQ